MWISGRADGYSKNMMFIATPTKMPYSTPITRHRMKVATIVTRSVPGNNIFIER